MTSKAGLETIFEEFQSIHIPVEVSLFPERRGSGVSVDVDPNPLIIDYHTSQEQTNIKNLL
jgi:hypothetical protein